MTPVLSYGLLPRTLEKLRQPLWREVQPTCVDMLRAWVFSDPSANTAMADAADAVEGACTHMQAVVAMLRAKTTVQTWIPEYAMHSHMCARCVRSSAVHCACCGKRFDKAWRTDAREFVCAGCVV